MMLVLAPGDLCRAEPLERGAQRLLVGGELSLACGEAILYQRHSFLSPGVELLTRAGHLLARLPV
jgi:hypothetical protein